jgi:aspartokinase-like uncharacterized kinase
MNAEQIDIATWNVTSASLSQRAIAKTLNVDRNVFATSVSHTKTMNTRRP